MGTYVSVFNTNYKQKVNPFESSENNRSNLMCPVQNDQTILKLTPNAHV